MSVVNNLVALNASHIYKGTNRKLNKSTEKLSSGYQVNRAADDAASLSISEKMRSQIRRLNQAANNIEDGISLIKTADGAMGEMHAILGRERELLVKAANDVNSVEEREAIENEIKELHGELDKIFDETQFNSIYLFKGNDTITDGPDVNTVVNTYNDPTITNVTTKREIQWFDKNVTPADTRDEVDFAEKVTFDDDYNEVETVNSVNDQGYTLYDVEQIYTSYKYTVSEKEITEVKYTKQPDDSAYTRFVKPGDMVGSNGYINAKNEAGNLDLTCAMSQLGVKVDGVELSLDLYSSSYPKSTTIENDGNIATTTFDLNNGISIKQKIELSNDSYNIFYEVVNNDTVDHDVQLRLAFDTINTPTTASNPAGSSSSFTLSTDLVSVDISAVNAVDSALGDISDLYNTWDDRNVIDGEPVDRHTGIGYWWDTPTTAGLSTAVGSVCYGPITLLKDAYEVETTVTNIIDRETEQTDEVTTKTILPEYLNIQSGANSGERIPVRLYNLSLDELKFNVGTGNQVSAHHASNSLKHIDRVTKKISAIRSYYGAMQNRMEVSYNNDVNYSENLQSAESQIRDTDMAKEMLEHTKNSILSQATQSMMSQINSNSQSVLSLLQ